MKQLPPPAVVIEPPFDRPSEQEQAAQAAAQVEEDDEDLKGDLQRAKVQRSSAPKLKAQQAAGSLLDDDGLGKLTISGNAGETDVPSRDQSKHTSGTLYHISPTNAGM